MKVDVFELEVEHEDINEAFEVGAGEEVGHDEDDVVVAVVFALEL